MVMDNSYLIRELKGMPSGAVSKVISRCYITITSPAPLQSGIESSKPRFTEGDSWYRFCTGKIYSALSIKCGVTDE